jgi:hypothetical protein
MSPLEEFHFKGQELQAFRDYEARLRRRASYEERHRILAIIMDEDWSGESLQEDRDNLAYRIMSPLVEEI